MIDLPPFPSSAMDGYAIRAADVPGTLRSPVTPLPAGRRARRSVPGEAIGIATGGVVPEVADAVVPIERVVALTTGRDRRPVVRGRERPARAAATSAPATRSLPAGDRLTPRTLGALAAAGVAEVACGRRPRVAIVVDGQRAARPGEPLGPGEIYESNGVMLAAALAGAGARVERLPAVPDDEDAHRAAIAKALEADVLVTSGGVSVGPHDLVRRIERELGRRGGVLGRRHATGEAALVRRARPDARVRPAGEPRVVARRALLFVRPALIALQGGAEPPPRAGHPDRRRAARPARDDFVRAQSA